MNNYNTIFRHTQQCYLGARRLKAKLEKEDNLIVGRKLIRCYIRNKMIRFSNQVWVIGITYIKVGKSHMYLTTIIDWYSRFITRWQLSDTLDTAHVLKAVESAIVTHGTPSIINSDQGSQFTSKIYANLLEEVGILQSMDGKAKWVDNVIIEMWFRSLKCEDIYINDYKSPKELRIDIATYIQQYNNERPHSAHDNQYPCKVYGAHFGSVCAQRVS